MQFFVKIAQVFVLMYLKSVSRVEVVCLNERKNKKKLLSQFLGCLHVK